MCFFVNTKYIHKHNVLINKTVTKLVTILTKCFFPYLNPTSYLKINFIINQKNKPFKLDQQQQPGNFVNKWPFIFPTLEVIHKVSDRYRLL